MDIKITNRLTKGSDKNVSVAHLTETNTHRPMLDIQFEWHYSIEKKLENYEFKQFIRRTNIQIINKI